MLNVHDFRLSVIRPALFELGLHSEAAENLVLGTAIMESRLHKLRQYGNGPALGLFQVEPDTHADLWRNWLPRKKEIGKRLRTLIADAPGRDDQLVTNLAYAAAVTRLIYYRRPEPLPGPDETEALAAYWKQFFNTPTGRGEPSEWVRLYEQFTDI